MNRFKKWILERIIREEVEQGYFHWEKTLGLYQLIREAWESEFTEDNQTTTNTNLRHLFESSLNEEFK